MNSEPVLMQYQEGAFNCDTEIEKEFLKIKDKFDLKCAVETGTCLGYTTKWLSENFDAVHTIEINEQYRNFALERLKDKSNVSSYLGSSTDVLKDVLKMVMFCERDKTILFLDAHWGDFCPLKDELKIIANYKLKPCIAIHDFKVPNKPEFGCDSTNGQEFTYEWLKPEFDAIYGENNYEYYYNTGVVEKSAMRGIIYVTPKSIKDEA